MSDDVFIDMVEDDSNTPPAELFCPKCGENIMSMSVHYCATLPAPVDERENLIHAACMAVVTERQGRYPGAARIADMVLNGATMDDTLPAERPTPKTDGEMNDHRGESNAKRLVRMRKHAADLERQLAEYTDALKSIHPTGRGTPAEMTADITEGLQAVRNALAEAREKIERQGERALIAEKRLGEALALAESNGKLAHNTAIELREAREQRDRLAACMAPLQGRDWFRDGESGLVTCTLDAQQVRAALAALAALKGETE